MAGRVVQTYKLADTSGKHELGKDLLPGVYFVRLSKNGSTIQTIKLIKTG